MTRSCCRWMLSSTCSSHIGKFRSVSHFWQTNSGQSAISDQETRSINKALNSKQLHSCEGKRWDLLTGSCSCLQVSIPVYLSIYISCEYSEPTFCEACPRHGDFRFAGSLWRRVTYDCCMGHGWWDRVELRWLVMVFLTVSMGTQTAELILFWYDCCMR